jgi:deoxyribonuclease V
MIACLDVSYRKDYAVAVCAVIRDWHETEIIAEYAVKVDILYPYVPGFLYKRELPCLLEVLKLVKEPISIFVVDGYCWLTPGRKGLGSYLFEALNRDVTVVGVAKKPFGSNPDQVTPILRGTSKRPLYVTQRGRVIANAAEIIRQMPGKTRLPGILHYVDKRTKQWQE